MAGMQQRHREGRQGRGGLRRQRWDTDNMSAAQDAAGTRSRFLREPLIKGERRFGIAGSRQRPLCAWAAMGDESRRAPGTRGKGTASPLPPSVGSGSTTELCLVTAERERVAQWDQRALG